MRRASRPFTYDSLDPLLANHERLQAMGIEPIWPVNHGPTTSLYYADPDGNQLEFQIDNYDTVERLRAGEDERGLKMRPPSGPRGVETIPIR